MKQSLSLCEAKRLLKITIWGKVELLLYLLCTEKRKKVREIGNERGTGRLAWGGREKEGKRTCEKENDRKRVGDPSSR